jgi:5,10-methenyltetrahydromethanopterin hydrogenase
MQIALTQRRVGASATVVWNYARERHRLFEIGNGIRGIQYYILRALLGPKCET